MAEAIVKLLTSFISPVDNEPHLIVDSEGNELEVVVETAEEQQLHINGYLQFYKAGQNNAEISITTLVDGIIVDIINMPITLAESPDTRPNRLYINNYVGQLSAGNHTVQIKLTNINAEPVIVIAHHETCGDTLLKVKVIGDIHGN